MQVKETAISSGAYIFYQCKRSYYLLKDLFIIFSMFSCFMIIQSNGIFKLFGTQFTIINKTIGKMFSLYVISCRNSINMRKGFTNCTVISTITITSSYKIIQLAWISYFNSYNIGNQKFLMKICFGSRYC